MKIVRYGYIPGGADVASCVFSSPAQLRIADIWIQRGQPTDWAEAAWPPRRVRITIEDCEKKGGCGCRQSPLRYKAKSDVQPASSTKGAKP